MTGDVAFIHPAAATVGDPITIDFPAGPVAINASPDYDVVSQSGTRAVLRTFKPKAFTVSGKMGAVPFRGLVVPVRSVLKANDPLDPAPLVSPHAAGCPKTGIAIGVLAAILIATVIAVLLSRRRRDAAAPAGEDAGATFRRRVAEARVAPMRWARLADALRDYLDATGAAGRELTTSEVVRAVGEPVVREILRQGDLEKFSPWGAKAGDFDALADAALRVAQAFQPAPPGEGRGLESPRHTGADAA